MLENDLHIFVEILLCIWCVISITSKVCNSNFSFQLRLLALKVAKLLIRYNAIHGELNYVFSVAQCKPQPHVFCCYHSEL